MSNYSPAHIRAEQHLINSNIETFHLGTFCPTDKSRISKPTDPQVSEEIIKILGKHIPEGSDIKVEAVNGYIEGPTKAFEAAIEEARGKSRKA
jgi:hypothetical protein